MKTLRYSILLLTTVFAYLVFATVAESATESNLEHLHLQQTPDHLIITTTDNSLRLPLATIPDNTFTLPLARGELSLRLPNQGTFEANIRYDRTKKLVTFDVAGALELASADIESALAIRLRGDGADTLSLGQISASSLTLTGHTADRIKLAGPLDLRRTLTIEGDGQVTINGEISAPLGLTGAGQTLRINPTAAIKTSSGPADLYAAETLSLQAGRLDVTGDLTLRSGQTLTLRDSVEQPLVIKSGGNLHLTGQQTVDIMALQHTESALISGGDMVLRSRNAIRGDVHYLSGGQVSFEQLDGRPADLVSPYDPIVLAAGDVSMADYSGASLHVLAGGSVTLNNVTITGADAAANTINPGNGATFNGVDTLGSLADFNLSNGAAVTIDGSAAPTLDVRAGIDWSSFTGGAPTNQVIPGGALSPAFSGAGGAAITVTGVISMAQPGGAILLTNQYRPNNLAGNISTGDIQGGTTLSNTNGSSIMIDARADMTTGALNTSAAVTGNGVTAGNGGAITLLAPGGSINTAGDVTAFARVPGNNSGSVGNGGSIFMAAAVDVDINNGAGRVESFAFANSDGDAGDGGDITVSAAGFSARWLFAQSFAGTNGSAGNGGTVSVNATNGAVILDSDFAFASIQTYGQDFNTTAGNAGAVTISATTGISLSHGIDARANGLDSQGGDIALTTTGGNISVDFLRTLAANTAIPGSAGNVTVQALAGGITTGDIDAYSNALLINNPSRNGGSVTLQALDGDVATGQIAAYSAARGALGDAGLGGNISIEAVNGGITGGGDLLAYSLSAVNNGDSSLAADGGDISLQASQNISVAGQLNASSEAQIFSGQGGTAASAGSISITTTNGFINTGNLIAYARALENAVDGGDISVKAATGIQVNNGDGVIDASTNSTDGSVGNGGAVTLSTSSGDFDLQRINSSAANTFGSGPAGNGGNINLTTGNGYIQLSGNFFSALDSSASTVDTAGQAGDISLSATQGITVSASIRAVGSGTDVDSGNISLITAQGNITTTDLLATSVNNSDAVGNGGNVTVQAFNGGITAGEVSAYALAFFINNTTGDGGNIILNAFNGDLVSGPIQSYTEARGRFGDTGDAGLVAATATNGSIIIDGDVRADAFSQDNNLRSGNAGDSQGITLQATQDITVTGGLNSFARSSRFDGAPTPTGTAGNAGPVTLTATNISVSYIDARTVATGTIGSGGVVQITAGQFFRATGNLFRSPATIDATGLSGSGAITISHGGNGITPFVIGSAATNGISGTLTTAEATIAPPNSYLFDHFEPPNIWILSVPFPELAITKTAAPVANAAYRGEITYSVVISNFGAVPADTVVFTDTLPGQVSFDRFLAEPGATTVNSGPPEQLAWSGSIPASQAVTFTYVVSHTGDYSDVFANLAEFSYPLTEQSGTASTTVSIAGPPVLSIAKTADPTTDVAYRGEVTYTIVLTNESGSEANNTLLTDTLPVSTTFARWVEQPLGASVSADEITFDGAVPANGAVTFSFVVSHTGDYEDEVTNIAEYRHAAGSGQAAATFTVEPWLSDLLISKNSVRDEEAGFIYYTIIAQNLGPGDASGSIISDPIPPGLTDFVWQCRATGAAVCTPNGAGAISDTLVTFPVGSQVTYNLTATLVTTDVVINEVTIIPPQGLTNIAPTNSAIDVSNPPGKVFFPLVVQNFILGPDLIVESLSATGSDVVVAIKNIGTETVRDGFWVDVYLDPNRPPAAVNDRWQDVGSQGIVWGVAGPNILPGQSVTLTLDHPGLSSKFSSFDLPIPVGSTIYAHVDAVNLVSDFGGVLEIHEFSGGAYNNIAGPFVTTGSVGKIGAAASAQERGGEVKEPMPQR